MELAATSDQQVQPIVQCIIDELLLTNFSSRSFADKMIIVKNGRPCPPMPNLISKHPGKTKKDEFTRHFSITQYKLVSWLSGCKDKNSLFCWPCLLFGQSNQNNIWTVVGFSDLNHLSTAQKKHEKCTIHITSFLKLKMFGKQRIDELLDKQVLLSNSLHNEKVRKNREVLKRLILTTSYLAKQELAFRGHDESSDSLNKGKYQEFLEAVREIDPVLDNHLQTSTVFRGTSATIQNDIIQAVSSVMSTEIKNQIEGAEFVSIMLDETTDVINLSQLSTVFRYVFKGILYERFVHFTDVSADRSASGLFIYVVKLVNDFGIEKKLVGQTYDGAAVMAGNLNGLQAKVLEKYPHAIFTHCYAHVLNLVLQQSLTNIRECRIFFKL